MAGAVQDGWPRCRGTLPRRPTKKGRPFGRPFGSLERRPPLLGRAGGHEGQRFRAHLPISDFALSGVIAVVGTVTTVSTFSAQSSRIFLAMSIASGPPVG